MTYLRRLNNLAMKLTRGIDKQAGSFWDMESARYVIELSDKKYKTEVRAVLKAAGFSLKNAKYPHEIPWVPVYLEH